jgi:orotate phosphoribosyltransferase
MTDKIAKEIAEELLKIKAVELSPEHPYTWASGLKAPIYTDNRLIISHPETRNKVENALARRIRAEFPEADVVAGTATAGIPHASIVAHLLELPMIYVRSSAKDHGKQSAIEGEFPRGAKVVMIEDLISTGGSVIQAAESVEEAGGKVIGCVAIFNYSLNKSDEAFQKVSYPLTTLTDYETLIEVATKDPQLSKFKETLSDWYKDPVAWSKHFN